MHKLINKTTPIKRIINLVSELRSTQILTLLTVILKLITEFQIC